MPNLKVLKDPGFLYDLNYLFYLKFNIQYCIDNLDNDAKKEASVKSLYDILNQFGEISDNLYVFYHAIGNGRCFMTTFYLNPYKDRFPIDFNFKSFKNLLSDTDKLIKNLIRFYLYDLSDEQVEECMSCTSKLFSYIKESDYSGEEKSKLYEFFISPEPYLQSLQYELIEKEILLSEYYKNNYEKILEAHNSLTFDVICDNIKAIGDLSFMRDSEQVLYTSFCLLNRYFILLFFVSDGAVSLLGYDYVSIISKIINDKKSHTLEALCAALGETSRIQILNLLLERSELTCKDLEKHFNFSGSTAYHHITLLSRVGAVKIRNEGKTIFYSLNRKYFDDMIDLLKKFSNIKRGVHNL